MGRPGGLWIRLLAYTIDSILLAIVFLIAWPLISGESIIAYWVPPEATDADLVSFEIWVDSRFPPLTNLFRLVLDTLYFTGAIANRPGRLKQADRGTLFLDEIGTMSTNLQSKLLRVLQEREFERVGDTQSTKVDVRFIAATNSDLAEMIELGRF